MTWLQYAVTGLAVFVFALAVAATITGIFFASDPPELDE